MRTLRLIALGIVGLFGLMVVLGSFYTVHQGERTVLTTNGALSDVKDPGLHFKVPFFQATTPISIQSRVSKWTCPTNVGDCGSLGAHVLDAYSADQQPAEIAVTVTYHIPPDRVAEVFSQYGSIEALADRVIHRQVPQELKVVFGQFNAVTVVQERAHFNQQVTQAISAAVKGPVVIDGVQIENIDFSQAYEQSVEQRMLAQVEVQRREQELQQERIRAAITVTQAQAQADSRMAQAKAEAEAIRLRGEAEAQAILARGKALADNPSLVSLTAAERWDGKLPTTMVPGSSVPFLGVR